MPTEFCSACPAIATQIRDDCYVCDGCAEEIDACHRIRQQESTFSVVDFTRQLCGVPKTTMRVDCAWCGRTLRTVDGKGLTGTTSSICNACLWKFFQITPDQLAEVCE